MSQWKKSCEKRRRYSVSEIILDARMIRHSGIGTYVRGLLGEYRNHPFFQKHSFGLALPPSLFSEGDSVGKLYSFQSPIYSLSEQVAYPFQTRNCALWHAPHYNIPWVKGKTRLVVTVHDLIHWIFQKEFYSPLQAAYVRLLFQRLAKSADRIITVSQRTRDDLIQYFKIPAEKIRVIYEGVSEEFFSSSNSEAHRQFLRERNLPEQFLLYVGLMKPHKNVERLIRVFKKLRREGKIKSPLVLVGKKDKHYPKGFESTRDLASGDGIHYLPGVSSRQELVALYHNALALVHPSLYEGFGLTCLEAMASGLPVAVSRAASLPEVVGEAGYYFDPYSEDSLAEALTTMESEERLRKELAQRGRERAREFSWAKTAEETIQVYREVLEGSSS